MINLRSVLVACFVIALLSPIWGFEVVVQVGLSGEELPQQPLGGPTLSPTFENALWLAAGERPGEGVDALWAGNYFKSTPVPGRNAAVLGARRIVYRQPERHLGGLQHHLRSGAVTVWLSRHATEAELKQSLAQESHFGRDATGGSAAALAFFGRPLERLSIGELALLAILPDAPRRYDPSCRPAAAAKRKAYVLGLMRNTGTISSSEFDLAMGQTITFVPPVRSCD